MLAVKTSFVKRVVKKNLTATVPDCQNCKYSIKENNILVCRLFKYSTVMLSDKKEFHYYMDTDSCRSDRDLCGPDGEYFKSL